MNKIRNLVRGTLSGLTLGGAGVLLSACAADAVKDPGVARARADLSQLQADPQLASRAPLALHDAEVAVQAAEQTRDDAPLAQHRGYLAERRVQIARTQAQTQYAVDQRKALSEQNGRMQLDARTSEADAAKAQAGSAKAEADTARAQSDADQRRNAALEAQLLALQAKKTDRGMVLTLGDVLFASGRSDLKAGSVANLDRLVSFLDQAPERSVRIEGHTDDRGGQELNQALSQKRAESVARYLTGRGIDGSRLTSVGDSYNSPVADNHTDAGRQANRRVEVIIQDAPR